MIHDLSMFAHSWKLLVILVYFIGGMAVPPVVCWHATSWSQCVCTAARFATQCSMQRGRNAVCNATQHATRL